MPTRAHEHRLYFEKAHVSILTVVSAMMELTNCHASLWRNPSQVT